MSDALTPVPATAKQTTRKKSASAAVSCVRQLIASLVWLYSVTELFIFDIDGFAIRHFSSAVSWLFSYKFAVLLCVIAMFWLAAGTKRLLIWATYIIGYPIVLIAKASYLIWKARSWVVVIGLLNLGLSLWRSFKFNFFATAIASASACFCIFASYPPAITAAAAILLIVIFALLIRKVISIFRPSLVYEMHPKLVKAMLSGKDSIALPPPEVRVVALAQMPEDVRKKWIEGLQAAVLLNRLAYFLSIQLSAYKKSRAGVFFHVLNFLILGVITLLILTTINFAVFRIDPTGFQMRGSANFFDFLYYTFSSMIGNNVDALLPLGWVERALSMLGVFFSLMLSGILLTLLFSVRLQRDDDEISDAARDIKAQADAMEDFIRQTFNLSVLQALEELERAKSGLIQILFFLQNEIE